MSNFVRLINDVYIDKEGFDSATSRKPEDAYNPSLRIPVQQRPTPSKIVRGQNINASIMFCNDTPEGPRSGYGGNGSPESACIDICVGHGSSLRTKVSGSTKSLGSENVIPKMFHSDAARIYMSQQADIDDYCGLPRTKHSPSNGHAGIAVKSDFVRVVGRTSVKIWAGKATGYSNLPPGGELNARGQKITTKPVIELIAGSVDDIQPVVKGTNLQKCLANIYDHIGRINQLLLQYDQSIITLRTSLCAHFHQGAGVGAIVTFPDPINVGQQIGHMPGAISTTVNNTLEPVNVEMDKANYLDIGEDMMAGPAAFGGQGPPMQSAVDELATIKGATSILSTNVYTT